MEKVCVVGLGYVGLSNAVIFAKNNEVVALDIDTVRVSKINSRKATVHDSHLQDYLDQETLSLRATTDKYDAYKGASYVIVAAPTNFNEKRNQFDTEVITSIISDAVEICPAATIIIRSTIPVGFTKELSRKFSTKKIIFSPEFLREGTAFYDSLNPSRVVIGGDEESIKKYSVLLSNALKITSNDFLYTTSCEAEAIKLFSNTYLAMRVAFFNEVDTFALSKGLGTKKIIDGVVLDERIGHGYNNPSFGYGGYCLPKDTRQLLHDFEATPQSLISAIVSSNSVRKKYLSKFIRELNIAPIGVYRLTMKKGSDNFRDAAIFEIIDNMIYEGLEVLIYEPLISDTVFHGVKITHDLRYFLNYSKLILANRVDENIRDTKNIVFTRDIYLDN